MKCCEKQSAIHLREFQMISYPKSGRTWIRYVFHQLGVADSICFHHDGFEFNDGMRPAHNFDLEMRKARYWFIDPIIYLRRDPRDLMVSLYYQVTRRFSDFFNYQGSLHDFIHDEYFGAEVLARFREMWERLAEAPNVITIDYEECHRDLLAVIRRILSHFQISLSEEEILCAVEGASFKNMKELEDSDSFSENWLRRRNDAPKVRQGKVGGFAEEFNQQDIAFLNDVFGI